MVKNLKYIIKNKYLYICLEKKISVYDIPTGKLK
jgi:hypothetical protein